MKRSYRPEVEELEARLAPVVGAIAPINALPQGAGYDGVVRLQNDMGSGSGSLITDHHVLTAAHNLLDSNNKTLDTIVYFYMVRDKVDVPPIGLRVPRQFQVLHPNYKTVTHENDIAILRLPDQTQSGLQDKNNNRFLIAPYGAERYGLFSGNAEGQKFEMVGYGRSGTGKLGESNEVQNILIPDPVAGGTFFLTFRDNKGVEATTGPIPQNATAHQVAKALGVLPNIGRLNVAVSAPGLAANKNSNTWNIRFEGKYLAQRNLNQLKGVTDQGAMIAVSTLQNGSAVFS